MNLIHKGSLAVTLAGIDAAQLAGKTFSRAEALAAARWIAARQGLVGCYAQMFAPTSRDWAGIRLVTGERIVTRAGLSHVLGEESCRTLRALGVADAEVNVALEHANAGMVEKLHQYSGVRGGHYCCATCTVSVWRHLAAGGLDAAEARLADGMRCLDAHREGDGSWRRFPFYYTVLALSEIPGDTPIRALRHAALRCERLLRRTQGGSCIHKSRRLVLERALARVPA